MESWGREITKMVFKKAGGKVQGDRNGYLGCVVISHQRYGILCYK